MTHATVTVQPPRDVSADIEETLALMAGALARTPLAPLLAAGGDLFNGKLLRAADFLPLVVAYRNGQPVRLQDVGRASDSVENDKIAAWYWSTALKDCARSQECTGGDDTPTTAPAAGKSPSQSLQTRDAHVVAIENKLRERLGTKVALRYRQGKGALEIRFFSDDELERVLEIVGVKVD